MMFAASAAAAAIPNVSEMEIDDAAMTLAKQASVTKLLFHDEENGNAVSSLSDGISPGIQDKSSPLQVSISYTYNYSYILTVFLKILYACIRVLFVCTPSTL